MLARGLAFVHHYGRRSADLLDTFVRKTSILPSFGSRQPCRDSAPLYGTQYLPVGDEDGHDSPSPGWHSCLGGYKEELSAVGAVVETLRVPVLRQQFTTISAGAFHSLVSDIGRQKRGRDEGLLNYSIPTRTAGG